MERSSLTHSGLGGKLVKDIARGGLECAPHQPVRRPFFAAERARLPRNRALALAHGYPLQPWAARIAGSLKACAPPA